MIELIFTGMCKGCCEADLSLSSVTDMSGRKMLWIIKCEHEAACKRMRNKDAEEKYGIQSETSN